jgi:hypothetical protein
MRTSKRFYAPGFTLLAQPWHSPLLLPASPRQARLSSLTTNLSGVSFNDRAPAEPTGGNPATDLCQQRLNAFTYAVQGQMLTQRSALYAVFLHRDRRRVRQCRDQIFGTEVDTSIRTRWVGDEIPDAPGAPINANSPTKSRRTRREAEWLGYVGQRKDPPRPQCAACDQL